MLMSKAKSVLERAIEADLLQWVGPDDDDSEEECRFSDRLGPDDDDGEAE